MLFEVDQPYSAKLRPNMSHKARVECWGKVLPAEEQRMYHGQLGCRLDFEYGFQSALPRWHWTEKCHLGEAIPDHIGLEKLRRQQSKPTAAKTRKDAQLVQFRGTGDDETNLEARISSRKLATWPTMSRGSSGSDIRFGRMKSIAQMREFVM